MPNIAITRGFHPAALAVFEILESNPRGIFFDRSVVKTRRNVGIDIEFKRCSRLPLKSPRASNDL
jgi:hypothetical protein